CYRHVVEDIAKGTGLEEADVAQRALDLALRAWATLAGGASPLDAAAQNGAGPAVAGPAEDRRPAHIGHYLMGDGRTLLEANTRFRAPPSLRLHRWVLAHADAVYFGGITVVTLVLLGIAFALVGPLSLGLQLLVVLFALIPANDIAVSIIHQIVTVGLPPRIL